MSDNDTVESAADKAALEDMTDDQVWKDAIKARSDTSSEDDAREVEDAAPEETEDGTDEKAEAPEMSEPAKEKTAVEPETKDAKKEETSSTDTERLKSTIKGQSRKISDLQREISAFADKKREGNDDISMDELVETYPELMGPMVDRLKRLEAQLGDQHTQLSKMSQLTREQHNEGIRSEEAKLDAEVPGWDKVINNDRKAFDDWVNDPDQPRWVFDTYKANVDSVQSAAATARLITAFQNHRGGGVQNEPASKKANPPKPSSSSRLQGAQEISTKGTQANLANEGNLTEDEIYNREVARRKALRDKSANPHRI